MMALLHRNWPGLILSAFLGTLLGSGGYAVYYGEGTSYLSNDPKACVNCHIMREQYDGWQKASHHAVATCNDCHLPHDLLRKYLIKAENGLWHSKGFTLQDFPEPIRIRPRNARILNQNCVECHRAMVSEIVGHAGNDEEAGNCVRCHSQVGHGPVR